MMSRWVLVAVACGCHAAIPPVPGQGGPAWLELTSEHFTVWTDASAEEGREVVKTMEHLRQIVFGVSVFNPTSNTRGFVIALRSQREVDPYLPKQFMAFAWPPENPLHQPGILLSVDGMDHDRRVVTHELTHVISFNAMSVQPRWFAEGLASYFETLQLDEDSGSFELGAPLDGNLRLLRREGTTSIAALFRCATTNCMDNQFYATAWALFAYLANKYPAELLRYVQRLTELPRNAQAGAWHEIFPDLTPDKLDVDLIFWIRTGQIKVSRFKVKLRSWPTTQRALTDAEVYAARALLTERFHRSDTSPPELAAALRIDPTNVVANMLRTAHDPVTPEVARAVAAAHPEDWRAWWLVEHTGQSDERKAARLKVCELIVKNPAVLPRGTCP